MDYNHIVVEKLSSIYPSKGELITMICDLLHMSKSTAYKKLNGSIYFSMEELIRLAKHNHFSLDNIFNVFSDQIQFSFPHFESKIKAGIDFVEPINNDLEKLSFNTNPFVYYTSSEIPIFHYFQYEELALFKFFIYEGTTWNTNTQKLRKFDPSELLVNKPLVDNIKSMANNYYKLDSEEYWTASAFDKTLGQIKYFLIAGLTDKEFALRLMGNIYDLLKSIEEMAKEGVKKIKYQGDTNQGKLRIFNNEIIHTGTTIYAKSDGFNTVYMTYDHPNYLRSQDTKLVNHTDGYFDKLKSKSYRITEGSDQHFYAFFNNIRSRIDKVYKEIELF